MYLFLSIFITLIGVILFLFDKKMAKNIPAIYIKVIGVILIVGGLFLIYLLLSGSLSLPLRKD